MHFIDRYAYGNRLRKIDPVFKAGMAGLTLVICLLSKSPYLDLAAIAAVFALVVGAAAIPAKVFGRILLAEFSFFVLATAGVAVSVMTGSPLQVNPWALHVGFLWVSTGPLMLQEALLTICRVMSCVAAMNFLALTTPMVDVINLLRRLRLPELLIDLMTLMYRFIFVLLESLERMVVAQEVRMGFNGWRRSLKSAAQIGANLFVEAFRRSRQLELALESRGWTGSLRVLPHEYEPFFRRHQKKTGS